MAVCRAKPPYAFHIDLTEEIFLPNDRHHFVPGGCYFFTVNLLRMSEVNEVDHQSMRHISTEGSVGWGASCLFDTQN